MTSPRLLAASKSTRTEAEVRPLNVAKASDRQLMAATIENIAREHGAQCERSEGLWSPRETTLDLSLNSLCISISLDGTNAQDRAGDFCLPWCVSVDSDAKLSEAFGNAMRASVNPHHRRKCTTFAAGWPDLCEKLRAGLTLAQTGGAFL
jgi:hypothetical protein